MVQVAEAAAGPWLWAGLVFVGFGPLQVGLAEDASLGPRVTDGSDLDSTGPLFFT